MSFVADFLSEIKRNQSRVRCLHFEHGNRCDNIISAHSIQKGNQLGEIAENGHVYRMSADVSILHKNNGRPLPKRTGLNKVSTFFGFCRHHDNKLFQPIDNFPLEPTVEQVSLYAYRCMCREFYAKENATTVLNKLKNHPMLSKEEGRVLAGSLIGHSLGFHRLKYHKKIYDVALSSKNFNAFEYITFESESLWSLQLSGVLYPDYNFQGERLQDLGNSDLPLDFISFFTGPTLNGWSLTLCWHASSNNSCVPFAESLRKVVRDGTALHDALLRFSMSCCENHAFRISWWDGLPGSSKAEILSRVELMMAPGIPVPTSYLSQGLEGIADWEFKNVATSLSSIA